MTTQFPTITDTHGRDYEITPRGLRRVHEKEPFRLSRLALVCIAFVVVIALSRVFA